MLQIVGALILLIAGFAILRLLFRALISTASALAGLILLCLFGPALLAGYITERITRLFHIRWLAGVFLTIAGMIISFMWGLDGKHIALEAHTFDSVKFILTTALAGGLLAVPLQIKNIQQNGITPEDISKEILPVIRLRKRSIDQIIAVRIPFLDLQLCLKPVISRNNPKLRMIGQLKIMEIFFKRCVFIIPEDEPAPAASQHLIQFIQ